MLIDKIEELDRALYKAFGDLHENKSHLCGNEQEVAERLIAVYKRDYELLNAEEFIDVDKKIEELKIKRSKELEAVKLERERLSAEIERERAILFEQLAMQRDKELEAVKLEHEKLMAEIAGERTKIEQELETLNTVIKEEWKVKREEMTPKDLPKKWWQRHARPNYAKELAEKAADIELDEYFDEREQAIKDKDEGRKDFKALLEEILPQPKLPHRRKKWRKQLEALALIFGRKELTRKEAEEHIQSIIREADEEDNPAKAFEEPKNGTETPETDEAEEESKQKNKPAEGKEKHKKRG